jgi:hypothetical protein
MDRGIEETSESNVVVLNVGQPNRAVTTIVTTIFPIQALHIACK